VSYCLQKLGHPPYSFTYYVMSAKWVSNINGYGLRHVHVSKKVCDVFALKES